MLTSIFEFWPEHGPKFKLSLFEIIFAISHLCILLQQFIEFINLQMQRYYVFLLCIFKYAAFLAISPRHRAATGPNRHRPIRTGTGPALTGTSLGSVHFQSLTVCAGRCRVKNQQRPLETRHGPCRPVPVPLIDRKKRCIYRKKRCIYRKKRCNFKIKDFD